MALEYSPEAIDGLSEMPKKDSEKMRRRLRDIAAGPTGRHPAVIPMRGKPAGRFRVRHGDWRAVYRIEGGDVFVELVGNRKEVYE